MDEHPGSTRVLGNDVSISDNIIPLADNYCGWNVSPWYESYTIADTWLRNKTKAHSMADAIHDRNKGSHYERVRWGIAGEIAAGIYLRCDFIKSMGSLESRVDTMFTRIYQGIGDNGIDGIYRGWTIDVKFSQWRKADLIVNPETMKDKADIYILVTTSTDNLLADALRVAGWIARPAWLRERKMKIYQGIDNECWGVSQHLLQTMDKLRGMRPKWVMMKR